MIVKNYTLTSTTQGPMYPPSEVMDSEGNFVVVGFVPTAKGHMRWQAAIVTNDTSVPPFGQTRPYRIQRRLDENDLGEDANIILHTLPLPLPSNNYPVLFAPDQRPLAHEEIRQSYPLHCAPIPDERVADGRRALGPVTLGQWLGACGQLKISTASNYKSALFDFVFTELLPNSLYTVMCLRQSDLNPTAPTRPGPLGIPNSFVTDERGSGSFWARLPNPFPSDSTEESSRIVNVVVLFMSSQQSYGGAIGWYGLGGDIHAQLKIKEPDFTELLTCP